MTRQAVRTEIQGDIAIVYLDRGKRKNALNFEIIEELTQAASSLSGNRDVRAVILTGTTDHFSTGMDLHEQDGSSPVQGPLLRARDYMQGGQKLCRTWENIPQPTIAAIEGPCVGAGVALTLACDWRVMAEDAFLYVPELLIAINLGWQSIPRLVNLVGPAKAKEIVILCDRMTADQALNSGLVTRTSAKAQSLKVAVELARRAAEMPPVAVRMVKQAINAHANALNDLSSYMDADQALLCVGSKDFAEGIAAFQEGRKPTFVGE